MQESNKREIRKKADEFRARCVVGRYGILDLFKDCVRNEMKLVRYPLDESAGLGFSLKKKDDIIIFTNSSSRLSREIFTLAHEIGHALLHLDTDQRFLDNDSTVSENTTEQKEKEANYFAACLLMPDDDVRRFVDLELPEFEDKGLSSLDIARIMSEFGVSFEMALNRLNSLGIIDSSQKDRLDNERAQRRVGNLLKSVGGNASLNISSGAMCIPHEFLDYVIYNYNHNAIPRERLEHALEYHHLQTEDIHDCLMESAEIPEDLDELIGELPF